MYHIDVISWCYSKQSGSTIDFCYRCKFEYGSYLSRNKLGIIVSINYKNNEELMKLEEEPARVLRCNIIHPPLIKRVYAECNLLFQLIKLINTLKVDPNDQILKKIRLKTHSYMYIGFGFNVTQIFLDQYNLTCTLR